MAQTLFKQITGYWLLSLLVLLAGLFLSGCAAQAQNASSGDQISVFSGEITTLSPMNVKDGSRYEILHLNLKADSIVQFRLEGALNGSMTLQDPQGLIAGSTGYTSESLSYEVVQPGRYTLYVSGMDANSYGPFVVNLEYLQVMNSGLLPLDQEIQGTLISNRNRNTYQLQIEHAGLYDIRLNSDDFDAYLEVSGNGISLSDDDGGDGLNARIRTQLAPGNYQLIARSYSSSAQGAYSLIVEAGTMPEGNFQNDGQVELGDRITGFYLSNALIYSVNVPEAGLLVVDMESDDFDSFLELTGSNVNVSNDDGGEGLNARIAEYVTPGNYQIIASSYSSSASGVFTLSTRLEPWQVVPADEGVLGAGQVIQSYLSETSPFDEYTVNIQEAGYYTIDMTSPTLDTYLELTGNGVNASDDDSGGNLNARLSVYLDAGSYTLQAKTYSRRGTDAMTNSQSGGEYRLMVSTPQ